MAAVPVEVTLLGPPRVRRDGEPVSFDTRKAIALLAHLAMVERPRPREALCNLLWPEHDPDLARGALRRTLSTLRGAIGAEHVEAEGDSIGLRQGPALVVDVGRFRELGADGASSQSLREAVAVHRGDFLEGFAVRGSPEFENWQLDQAAALRHELSAVLRRLTESLVEQGELVAAIPYVERWLAADELHEAAHRELMRLYAWSGHRGRALEQYRRCVSVLDEELGVAPVEETVALRDLIDRGTLPPPTAPRPPAQPSPAPVDAVSELPMVGREAEMVELLRAHAEAAPNGRLAVIEGEPGIGKTRLVRELVAHARQRGAAVLVAHAYDGETGIAFGPVVELLRGAHALASEQSWPAKVGPQTLADASVLLPALVELRPSVVEPRPLAGLGALTRLLEAVGSILTAACDGPAAGLVVLDDVHAADDATLEAVTHLARRLRGRRLLLVLTWRSERVPPGHRLRRLVVDLARDGLVCVAHPSRLSREDVVTLAASVELDDPAVAERVHLESEGLPFFVAEYLTSLRGGNSDGLPAEVRGLLDSRLEPLGEVPRQVLGAAAVLGHSFDLDLVRTVSGRTDEETVAALEEILGQGLVHEATGSTGAYDFSHHKLREMVYEDTSLARRRLLHRRAASALSRLQAGPGAALVARHLAAAGDAVAASEQHRIAAEHAAAVHANVDALEHLQVALALGPQDAAALRERVGDLSTLVGDYTRALASYERAAAQAGPPERAILEHKIGGVHNRRGEWERAESRLRAALETASPQEQGLRARISADLALTLHHAGRASQASSLLADALALAEAVTDRSAEAQAHNLLGVFARGSGGLEDAARELERSLAIAHELGDEPAQAAALNNLALVRRQAGDLDAAMALTEEALALCTAYGDRHRQAALENNIADLHHEAGRQDAAMAHLKRAVTLFAEVGADDRTRLPEIWKLVSW